MRLGKKATGMMGSSKRHVTVAVVSCIVVGVVVALTVLPERSRPRLAAETVEIGRSVQDRPIHAIRVGSGPRVFVIAGTIHGDEGATTMLVEDLAARLGKAPESLPADVSLFLVPTLNPDGLARRSRCNARGVDLNRNWATNNWRSKVEDSPGAGGASPFCEPETAALSRWLLALRDRSTERLRVVMYHCAYPPSGLVQPGYRIVESLQETDPNAQALAQYWASKVGYTYCPAWPDYAITGEAIHWCAENEITCIDIELPGVGRPTRAEVRLHQAALAGMIRDSKKARQ